MTTNNDTPQIFDPGAPDDDVYPGEWPDGAGRAGPGAGPAGPGAFDAWGEEFEGGAADRDDPQPSSHSRAAEYPQGIGYTPDPGDQPVPRNHHPVPGEPGYPPGPGDAADADYARQLGYPQDPGYGPGPADEADPAYEADSAYEADPGPGYANHMAYLNDAGYAKGTDFPGYPADADTGRAADTGYFAPDADLVPPMEPLPGLEVPAAGVRRDAGVEPGQVRETSDSLTTESLLHGKRAAPGSGWRRSVYRATGGLLRFGESAAEMRRRDLINRVRTPVAGGHHRVAVLSLKGGVGKTTTAVGLGATLATLRGDRVIAVDANPDRGTLSDKVRLETAATIRDLLNEREQVLRYADVRAFTSQAPSRLEVLASDRDPGVSVAFGADDYCDAARLLEHFYSICITDCGTGLLHSAMSGVLQLADQIVLVSSPSVDGARSASATLDWLEAHRCGDLVRNAVVVLSAIRPKSKSTVDLDRLEHHFAARCRAVARIPYDPHLEEGAEVELELLSSETAEAYLVLAATVGDGLAWPRRLTSRSALP